MGENKDEYDERYNDLKENADNAVEEEEKKEGGEKE